MADVTVYDHVLAENVMLHLGERDFIIFYDIPISTIELLEGRFKIIPDISLLEKLS